MIDFWSELKEISLSSPAIRPSWRAEGRHASLPRQRLGAIRHLFAWPVTGRAAAPAK
jgi:hypothetical protein